MSKRILFISNGHGEDFIAVELIKVLLNNGSQYDLFALPMVGNSGAYDRVKGVQKIGPQKDMSSGGFIKSVKNIFNDLKDGLIGLHFKQMMNARKQPYDLVVAVGDFFPFIMSVVFLKYSKLILISTAKSDRFESHFLLERYFFKKHHAIVYVRDIETEKSLVQQGVNALYKGNIMMDMIHCPAKKLSQKNQAITIGVLPGSRHEAYQNFELIKQVINHLPKEWSVQIAVPSSLNKAKFSEDELQQAIIFTTFEELLSTSDAVIGLAGTANEQCIGCGIPLFTFPATGMQTTRKRFIQQKKLLNNLVEYVDTNDSAIIAKHIVQCLESKSFIENVQINGPKAMGKPGGARAIAGDIKCILES
ncbi:MAG: hypothetical protein A2Y40_03800 [Candidatus Margulisbacteria bacterium GWF2_35_9]|nr:MAG: hypothetical protein A2Y40_03800 [Candidatus Margulisbacteria bacterium GWF2_35_9]